MVRKILMALAFFSILEGLGGPEIGAPANKNPGSFNLGNLTGKYGLQFPEIRVGEFYPPEKAPGAESSPKAIETHPESDIIYQYINRVYNAIKVPEYLNKKYVRSLIWKESQDTPRAKSHMDARGLMQITREAWEEVTDLDYDKWVYEPLPNVAVGIKYLSWIDKECEKRYPNWKKLKTRDRKRILSASYNGGIGGLEKNNWDIEKRLKETRDYVKKIEKLETLPDEWFTSQK